MRCLRIAEARDDLNRVPFRTATSSEPRPSGSGLTDANAAAPIRSGGEYEDTGLNHGTDTVSLEGASLMRGARNYELHDD